MKKRILSILTALCLCLMLLPTAALADSGEVTTEEALKAAVANGGTVKLDDNITLSSPLTITGTVTLDLNGKTLSGAKGADGEAGGDGGTAIIVNSGSLTVSGTGSIIGGNGGKGLIDSDRLFGGNGGVAITVENSGSLTVSGGSIVGGNGGSGTYGARGGNGGSAITVESGSLTVSGGEIVGGNGGNGGDSFSNAGNGGNGGDGISITGGDVSVGGSATITDGTAGNGGSGGSSDGSDGADGKKISTSGTGSIGVSSAAALTNALSWGATNIKLTDNITITETLTITGMVTLDLNDHVLQYKNSTTSGSVIKVASGGNLTLKDSAPTTPHSFTVDSTGLWSLCTATDCSHEHKTVKGGIITGGTGTGSSIYTSGGGVFVDDNTTTGGTFNMTGGSIVGCTANRNGGGVFVDGNNTTGGTFNMTGGSIVGCTAKWGGGVYINQGAFNMTGGSIENCTVNGDYSKGGGVYVIGGSFDMSDGTIRNCSAVSSGGGVCMGDNGATSTIFIMSGGTIENCTAMGNSGNVYVTSNGAEEVDRYVMSFTMTGGTITGDNATGGVHLGDTEEVYGGTMYANGGTVNDTVYVDAYGKITRSADAADYTTFNGTVTNNGTIADVAKLTVTFNNNYDGAPADTTQKVLKGQKAEQPTTDPTREGYTFGGWYTAQTGGEKFDFNSAVTGNTTLYAKWTAIPTGTSSGGSSSAPTYSVTAPTAANGTVKSDRRTAEAGEIVTLTVIPDAGYTLETLTVLDKNGKEIALTDLGNGKYSFKMPAGKVTVNATFMDDNTMLNFFVDVPADAYYYDAVLWAAKNGITGGIDENHFAPYASCTRAQIVTFLYRWAVANGVDVSVGEDTNILSYNDAFTVPEYAVPAFQWAVGAGILQGNDGNLMPNSTCTRAQAVAFLFRFAAANDMDFVTLQELVSGYSDAASVPGYALSAFNWALAGGIVQGNDGNLMPKDPCTRAQIVTMLYRLLGE